MKINKITQTLTWQHSTTVKEGGSNPPSSTTPRCTAVLLSVLPNHDPNNQPSELTNNTTRNQPRGPSIHPPIPDRALRLLLTFFTERQTEKV